MNLLINQKNNNQMQSLRLLFLLMIISSNCALSQGLQEIYVKSGETKRIPARTYKLNKLNIEKGGVLSVIENSRQWLVFHVEGRVIIDGSIVFENFYYTRDPIATTSPDGEILSHTFKMDNLGGDGGRGSFVGGSNNHGGDGAKGTIDFGGGGGGGGVHYVGVGTSPGKNAIDYKGGQQGGSGQWGRGGDGSRRSAIKNGGLIYFYVNGTFSGNGKIFLRGQNGGDGQDGDPGRGDTDNNRQHGSGAGGGGGGAPGGEGGRLIIKAKDLNDQIEAVVNGGIGGEGGGATTSNTTAEKGDNGQDGPSGYRDYLDF
jgi:hypothetical protein